MAMEPSPSVQVIDACERSLQPRPQRQPTGGRAAMIQVLPKERASVHWIPELQGVQQLGVKFGWRR